MSQRDSGYERKERDLYETPEWVTLALMPHLPGGIHTVWEPACGSGKMSAAIAKFYEVYGTDIETGYDFLNPPSADYTADAIITNPPYEFAQQFIQRSLDVCQVVAMLLRTDFDHAKSRQHLFGARPHFAKKIVLTKRIRWFEDSKGSPSFNHAWFIWDWRHKGAPTLAYGP